MRVGMCVHAGIELRVTMPIACGNVGGTIAVGLLSEGVGVKYVAEVAP